MQRSAAPARDYVRSFNRFELKYVLERRRADAFRADLAATTRLDPNSPDERRGYPVYSIYWDSPELTLFWEKLDGVKYRRKLRFRRYAGSDEAFVEIKQRIDRTVQKRRARFPVEAIQRSFDWGAPPGPGPEVDERDPVAMEAWFLVRHYRLRPRMAVAYRRLALFGLYDPDLRITFDTHLQCHGRDLDLDRPFERGKYFLPPDRTVLEIKFDERVPLWLCKLARKHELELVRMSKYCSAVDLEVYGGRYT